MSDLSSSYSVTSSKVGGAAFGMGNVSYNEGFPHLFDRGWAILVWIIWKRMPWTIPVSAIYRLLES
ncbi:MAG: hypothetical protein H7832_06410 [Magnetococcus sp. DMHC-6]